MVAPKTFSNCDKQNSDGDKSPSPEPFKEPEGLVSIDLQAAKRGKHFKNTGDRKVKYKEQVLKILVLVFIVNIIILIVFAIMVFLNEEKYLFKTKPLSPPIFSGAEEQNIFEQSADSSENMIIQCLEQNSLSVCCDFFKNAEIHAFNLGVWCNLDRMIHSIDMNIRRKRESESEITLRRRNKHDIVNKITDFVGNNVPKTMSGPMYDDNYGQNRPVYYDYDYDYQHRMRDYDNDMGKNTEYMDYRYNAEAMDYQENPIRTENHPENPIQYLTTTSTLSHESSDYHRYIGPIEKSRKNEIGSLFADSKNMKETDSFNIDNNRKMILPKIEARESETTTRDIPYSISLNLDFSEYDELAPTGEDLFSLKQITTPGYNEDIMKYQAEDGEIASKTEYSNIDSVSPMGNSPSNKNTPHGSTEENIRVFSTTDSNQYTIYTAQHSDMIMNHIESTKYSIDATTKLIEPFEISSDQNSIIDSDDPEKITKSMDDEIIDDMGKTDENDGISIVTMSSVVQYEKTNDGDIKSISKTKKTSDEHRANEVEDNRSKMKTEFSSPTVEMQSIPQAMFNPCFSPYPNPFYNPYKMTSPAANDGSQVMKVVPTDNQKYPQFILNPPMYPYMHPSYLPTPQYMPNYWQQPLQQSQSSNPIQVSGPGGQFYVCNPIPPVTNNIASFSGIEVRREASNLQDMLIDIPEELKASNKSREALIICPLGQQSCDDGSKCVPKHHVCDNEVHCEDGSDETFCKCRDRVGKLRTCDGYFDCPDGQDELGCFGCNEDEFSCDDWSRFRKSTCIPIENRCDGTRQCEITGKDEEDCSVLADNVGDQPQFKISNSVGFLHRNYRGKWYPTCFGTDLWATEICQTESGPTSITPKSHMMLTTNNYDGQFINISPNNNVNLVKNCVQDRAAFVECPPLFCGLRLTIQNPYRPQEVDISAENMINDLEREVEVKNGNMVLGNPRVVGGKPSQPAAWPWLVSIYKNGIFHCGGVLINEMWIVTAAHCVHKYWLYYYEIQAGMLRRFSYAPMEQHRWSSIIIANENYDKSTLKNDIALMKLSSPVRFNRYVRPICLPSEATAGRTFMEGPLPGIICTTVGWGATVEHGSDPDHMREVEVPIVQRCKHSDDKGGDEICAGLSEGGRDACQGDSGGPLMCRNPNNPSQWYLAGIVSHGEGCARPDEPGVYTKVSKYVGWIAENIGSERFFSSVPLQSCPGYICKFSNQCLPKKHHCDKIVDCLFGDDETSCKHSFHSILNHSRRNPLSAIMREKNEEEIAGDQSNFENFMKTKDNVSSNRNDSENSSSTMSDTKTNIQSSRTDNFAKSIVQAITGPHPSQDHQNGTLSKYDDKYIENHNFSCESLFQSIPLKKRCNKVVDCEDGTDEDHCSCADYIRNYNSAAICDGATDCFDESDEMNCSNCDTTSEYYCRQSKQCIPLTNRCDGVADCLKTEDEWDCAALTNGKTLTLDSDLRPELAMSGIITINRFGVWRPFCSNMSDNEASIVTNVCNLLGFEEYVSYHKYLVEDRPIEVSQKNKTMSPKILAVNDFITDQDVMFNGTNKCSGLNVRCSVVSLDKSVHIDRPDNVTGDVELYTSPWNAVIYSDGIYRCMGTILDPWWIITSVNCFKGITTLRWHYVTVLLGTGKSQLQVQGPHEQIFRVIEAIVVPNSDIILLGTDKNITYTRYVKNAILDMRRDGRRKERCIAIGLHGMNGKYIRLTPIEFCYVGFRCFESNVMGDCEDSKPWSGTIVCDSSNGWYPAAVYHEATGPCGLTAVKKYTSIPFYKRNILNIMKHAPIAVDAPPCDGFRCALGECININKTCDGIPDCRSEEDEAPDLCYRREQSCHLKNNTCDCPLTHLKCKNSKCVPKSNFCDTNNDCDDNSDEPNSCSCRAYLELTDPGKICDGIIHCLDRTDEDPKFCPCGVNNFNCISIDVCVSNDMICDGIEDCPNGEDEKICYDLSSNRGRRSNAGEVMKQTAGIWHRGCFNMTYNTTELEEICEKLGFFNSSSIQLKPPHDTDLTTTLRPVFDQFDEIWIHRNQSNKLSIGLRRGNRPYIEFVPDENCYRLFVACL